MCVLVLQGTSKNEKKLLVKIKQKLSNDNQMFNNFHYLEMQWKNLEIKLLKNKESNIYEAFAGIF